MIQTQPSCNDIYETDLLHVDTALQQILSALPLIETYQMLAIEQAKGRVLAEAIIAPFNVPRHHNSAVDGYCISANETQLSLQIVDVAYAGKPCITQLTAGQCIRIMTGAKIPEGVDSVIMQEQVQVTEQHIAFNQLPTSGQNIRLAGEDLSQHATILKHGKCLTPADIGLIASLGIAEIKVKRKLRVAIASTGNEVISLGESAHPDSLYDSNRYSLISALDRPDMEVIDLGILEDNPDALFAQFQQASQHADLIISSGGVSVGDADYTKTALQQSGQVDFWKVAIKPGRPLAFGKINNSVFFGLPGNPVAVMVIFYQFVIPALEKMLGLQYKLIQPQLQVPTLEPLRKKVGRTEIVRAILQQQFDGSFNIKPTGKQGSGILQSMSLANAFIILEHDRDTVQKGELVTVQPFSSFI